jgi:hypothetical protein
MPKIATKWPEKWTTGASGTSLGNSPDNGGNWSMVLKKSAVSAAEPLFGALKGYLLLRPFGIAVPRPIWGAARRI